MRGDRCTNTEDKAIKYIIKALLDARVGLHEPRVWLAQTSIMTSPTRLKQRVAIISKSGSRV